MAEQNVYDGLECTNILTGCYSDFLEATDINEAATACYCDYGISYLDCFFSKVATGTCSSYYFGTEGKSGSVRDGQGRVISNTDSRLR